MVEQRERIREELTGEVSVEHHLRIVRKCQRHLELFRNLGLLIIAVVTVSILVSDILATGRPAGAIPFQAGKPPVIMLGLQTGNATIIKNTSGISTVREKINIRTNAANGYNVTMSGKTTKTDLVNDLGGTIPATHATLSHPTTLSANSWGVALPGETGFNTRSDYESTDQSTLGSTKYMGVPVAGQGVTIMSATAPTDMNGDDRIVYYGVNVPDLAKVQAGEYKVILTYTATAKLPPAPTLREATPNHFHIDREADKSQPNILMGTNLATAYQAFVDINGNGRSDSGEECQITEILSDSAIVCRISASVNSPIEPGRYNLYVVTQGGTAKLERGYRFTRQSLCTNADARSDCQVDIDDHMIPIRYIGSNNSPKWQTMTKGEIAGSRGSWYSYLAKRWANAVTVKPDKLTKYKNKSVELDNDDVLGYWVYIPRYAYEVQRRDATDHYVPGNNFSIHFEKATDTKKRPAPSCNANIRTVAQMWHNGVPDNNDQNILAKTYWRDCGIDRAYTNDLAKANKTTWATHPAFSLGNKELNGVWIGKFELTGERTAPTIKPNQIANVAEGVAGFFTISKKIGANDPKNVGGGDIAGIAQNSHNLAKANSRIVRPDEWGAAAYLTASIYGSGWNGVKPNRARIRSTSWSDADGDRPDDNEGVTGCGPGSATDPDTPYVDDGETLTASHIESPLACSKTNPQRAYQGSLGQLASTTGNVYGIYDMAGGTQEGVAGNATRFDVVDPCYESGIGVNMVEPYVRTYQWGKLDQGSGYRRPWSVATKETWYNYDVCTWETCGGQALYETKNKMSVSANDQSWGDADSIFPNYNNVDDGVYCWTAYGGEAGGGEMRPGYSSRPGIFSSRSTTGIYDATLVTSRAVLALPPS